MIIGFYVINENKYREFKRQEKMGFPFISKIKVIVLHRRASLIRPAPAESPQVRKEARVGGCSGAI